MSQDLLDRMLRMMSSQSDSDAVMGLRGLQGFLQEKGLDLSAVVKRGLDTPAPPEGSRAPQIDAAPVAASIAVPPPARAPVAVGGMPQCTAPKEGFLELIAPGQSQGELIALPGAAAGMSRQIAEHLKDALVAATINKSRFKLKLLDIKNGRGETVETALQAEYEREGMAPIRVWVNVRGEVAALASVLRRVVANSFPDLMAA